MTYCYFLLIANGDIYKGLANDLRRRYQEHSDRKVASTRAYRPLELIGYEANILKSDALRREKFLKTTEG